MMTEILDRRIRCQAEEWECSIGEWLAANTQDDGYCPIPDDELAAVLALAIGESCNLGGGAAGITTVERIG